MLDYLKTFLMVSAPFTGPLLAVILFVLAIKFYFKQRKKPISSAVRTGLICAFVLPLGFFFVSINKCASCGWGAYIFTGQAVATVPYAFLIGWLFETLVLWKTMDNTSRPKKTVMLIVAIFVITGVYFLWPGPGA